MAENPVKIINPNKALWDNYDRFAARRGWLVKCILQSKIQLPGTKILDVGCGTGHISRFLARDGAHVTAIDPNWSGKKTVSPDTHFLKTSLIAFNGPPQHYHAVVLTDVLEHLYNPLENLIKIHHLLKSGGWLFITTPNKYSPFNLVSDPHYSLPGIAGLKRRHVKKIITTFGWHSKTKSDFPQLLSFKNIEKILYKSGFCWQFVNCKCIHIALEKPECVWSRPFHLALVSLIRKFGLKSLVLKIINDRKKTFNKFINPTFFILAQKRMPN